MQSSKTKRVGCRVTEVEKRRYERLARKWNRPLSEVIRILLEREVEKAKKARQS